MTPDACGGGAHRWHLALYGAMGRWPLLRKKIPALLSGGGVLPLCRMRATPMTGGFVIYRARHDDYQDNFLPTGLAGSAAENALDTAGGLSLNDPAWT